MHITIRLDGDECPYCVVELLDTIERLVTADTIREHDTTLVFSVRGTPQKLLHWRKWALERDYLIASPTVRRLSGIADGDPAYCTAWERDT